MMPTTIFFAVHAEVMSSGEYAVTMHTTLKTWKIPNEPMIGIKVRKVYGIVKKEFIEIILTSTFGIVCFSFNAVVSIRKKFFSASPQNLCTCKCRHCIACIFKLINNWICIVFVNRDFWLFQLLPIVSLLSLAHRCSPCWQKVQTHQTAHFFLSSPHLAAFLLLFIPHMFMFDSKSYLCIKRVGKGLSNGFYGEFYNSKSQQVKFILKKC